jgi:hypothetical protein
MIRRTTLVLATFRSDFALHSNMNGTPHLLLWTCCDSVPFVHVFLQKTQHFQMHIRSWTCYIISVPSGGLVTNHNRNQCIRTTLGWRKFTVNSIPLRYVGIHYEHVKQLQCIQLIFPDPGTSEKKSGTSRFWSRPRNLRENPRTSGLWQQPVLTILADKNKNK